MRPAVTFLWVCSIVVGQGTCVPGWGPPGEFPLTGVNGQVYAMTAFDDGTGPALYVGGAFTVAGGFVANNIAKWNGSSWSALGSGLIGAVYALAVHDDGTGPALYVGGEFSGSGSTIAPAIAKWDGASWSAVGTTAATSTVVIALATHDDGSGSKLFAGGSFGAAVWNGIFWAPVGGGVNGQVRALASCNTAAGPRLYAAGPFTVAGGVPVSQIASWDGGSWSNLGSGATTAGIFGMNPSLASFDDGSGEALYVGGDFTVISGFPALHLARWNGTSWSAPPPLPNAASTSFVTLAVISDGSGPALYAATASPPGTQIAKLMPSGWAPFGVVSVGVNALAGFVSPTGPTVFAGGIYGFVAQWTGTAWAPLGLGAGLTFNVSVVAGLDDGAGTTLYAGGVFPASGAGPATCIAKRVGSTWSPLGSGVSGGAPYTEVRALADFDDGTGPAVYAGGRFTMAGGAPASNIARWDGASWSAVGSGLGGGTVHVLVKGDLGSGSRLFAAGSFGIAQWDGATWAPLGSGVTGNPGQTSVHGMVIHDDGSGPALYVSGYFSAAGGVSANGMARWNGTSWSAVPGGVPAFTLAVFDDGTGPTLYAGGVGGIAKWNGAQWSSIGSVFTFALAGFNDGSGPALYAAGYAPLARWNGTAWSTPGGGITGTITPGASQSATVSSLAVFDDGGGPALFMGGDFLLAGGSVSAGVARWTAGGSPQVVQQPSLQVVDPGTPVTLSVTAIGSPSLSYQWRQNGVDLPGASSHTLAVPTATPANNASYDVVITNPCGTTTSQPAYVIIRPAVLSLTQSLGPGSLVITNSSGVPGSHYFSAFSFASANASNPGNGFWLGLHIPYPDLLSQFVIQAPPFVGTLDQAGGSFFALPPGSIPGSLLNTELFAVTAVYDPVTFTIAGGSSIASRILN